MKKTIAYPHYNEEKNAYNKYPIHGGEEGRVYYYLINDDLGYGEEGEMLYAIVTHSDGRTPEYHILECAMDIWYNGNYAAYFYDLELEDVPLDRTQYEEVTKWFEDFSACYGLGIKAFLC